MSPLLKRFQTWWDRLESNYQFLRRVLDEEARRYETLDYDAWLDPELDLSCEKIVDGYRVCFSADTIATLKNGDLELCIDITADKMPTKWGVKPSYHFFKRRDGSVYY